MPTPPTEQVVASGHLPDAVQQHLAAVPRFARMLARAPVLDATAFRLIYEGKPSADTAAALCARELTAELRYFVLSTIKETRKRPLTVLLEHNVLTADEQELLAAIPITASAAAAALFDARLSPATKVAIAGRASPVSRLNWLMLEHARVDDVHLFDLVADALAKTYVRHIRPYCTTARSIDRARSILWCRPPVGERIARSSYRHINFALCAAALELSHDGRRAVLDALVSTSTPEWSEGRSTAGLIALYDRPDLANDQRRQVRSVLNANPATQAISRQRSVSGSLRHIGKQAELEAVLDRAPLTERATLSGNVRELQWADLASNEHLTDSQARRLRSILHQDEVVRVIGKLVLYHALKALAGNHPGLRIRPRRPTAGRTPRLRETWQPDPIDDPTEIAFVATRISLPTARPQEIVAIAKFFATRLGDHMGNWQMLLSLLDDWTGTPDELLATLTDLAA